MTQEEKEIIIKDLCARLRCGVIVKAQYKDGEGWKTEDRKLEGIYDDGQVYVDCVYTNIDNIKPYLRPMSSMTKKEKNEFREFIYWQFDCNFNGNSLIEILNGNVIDVSCVVQLIDWLNKKMFDYRGLIPMSLALEAPEGMYNN